MTRVRDDQKTSKVPIKKKSIQHLPTHVRRLNWEMCQLSLLLAIQCGQQGNPGKIIFIHDLVLTNEVIHEEIHT